ncbi:P-loop containing nucleoside triphosphate hydrolases superfamily protein [Actinidia rufa]|uniref:P-loop containing nucleoside triphosphate hydrolases superfamily protein n=1 Tax=Actinidia rufa TaxID=165716 RepID=A0A7J0G5J2_9ERIC|nr:P-loop containing nucleoside triphosphate hydrolases superfamily protein [Actinidia rufa]
MAKGDDAVRKKKNKANRKKQNRKDSSSVSSRVAAIIAAKKRRQSGKRRNCQGMCFSLPTPEDPFNDKHEKMDIKGKVTKKLVSSKADRRVAINGNGVAPRKGAPVINHQEPIMAKVKNLGNGQTISLMSIDNAGQKNIVKPVKEKIQLIGERAAYAQQRQAFEHSGCPSKFLILCLNSIQNALRHDGFFSTEEDKPLFVDKWGVAFWKCYSVGKDILETGGACSTTEQIAWIASTAADSIARKEKEGLSLTGPFLLFIVPSQEKASKVRSVCKPLKALGVHTVSLHPGASIDHQIHGLKSCEPEFLVSTPERLLELVSLKAIDISGVSLLCLEPTLSTFWVGSNTVVDGLETFLENGYLDVIKSIRQHISTNPPTVVFSDCLSYGSGIQVLDQACGDQLKLHIPKVLFIVGNDSNSHQLVTAIKSKGYFVSINLDYSNSEVENSKNGPAVVIVEAEHVNSSDLGEFEVVIISDFVCSIDDYVQTLTKMARYTINGVLHSLLTSEDAILAGPLIEILEKCGQAVPNALRNLCHSISMSEH